MHTGVVEHAETCRNKSNPMWCITNRVYVSHQALLLQAPARAHLALGVAEDDGLRDGERVVQVAQRVKLPLLALHRHKELLDALRAAEGFSWGLLLKCSIAMSNFHSSRSTALKEPLDALRAAHRFGWGLLIGFSTGMSNFHSSRSTATKNCLMPCARHKAFLLGSGIGMSNFHSSRSTATKKCLIPGAQHMALIEVCCIWLTIGMSNFHSLRSTASRPA